MKSVYAIREYYEMVMRLFSLTTNLWVVGWWQIPVYFFCWLTTETLYCVAGWQGRADHRVTRGQFLFLWKQKLLLLLGKSKRKRGFKCPHSWQISTDYSGERVSQGAIYNVTWGWCLFAEWEAMGKKNNRFRSRLCILLKPADRGWLRIVAAIILLIPNWPFHHHPSVRLAATQTPLSICVLELHSNRRPLRGLWSVRDESNAIQSK